MVRIAENKAMDKKPRTFKTSAKATSLRIPGLVSRDGQPRYVRVQTVNGPNIRTSERIEVRPAAPAANRGEPIVFATQNVLCPTCKVNSNTPAFAKRWPLIMAQVKANPPDVVLLQEAWNTKGSTKDGMFAPFASALAKAGYALDRPLEPNATSPVGNRIAFKASKYTHVKSGSFAIPGERLTASWVLLKSRKTGKAFYAVSAHISPYIPVTGKNSQTSSAEVINTRMDALNKSRLPVLMGGDTNVSQNLAGTTNPHTVFIKRGWTDMASAPKPAMAAYGAYNGLRTTTTDPTWGRIDYLYTRNLGGPTGYRNIITVSKSRTTSRHGSDHNMIIAQTRLK